MTILIGTVSGAMTLDGDALIRGTGVNHVTRLGGEWWAVDDSGGLHHGGQHVASLPDGVKALCVRPTGQAVWVGADRSRLFLLDGDTLVEDEFFADAPGRETWYTPWGEPADIRSMALDADHTLYINVHVGGVLRYDNTGIVPTIDIEADVHQVLAHPTRKGAVFAPCARGLAVSRNGHDFEIRSDGLHAPYCRAVAVVEDSVILSASTGPRTDRGRLYRGGLWDGEFEPLLHGLPEWFDGNVNTHCLVAHEEALYVGHGDTVWRSDDGGDRWDVAVRGIDQITCLG